MDQQICQSKEELAASEILRALFTELSHDRQVLFERIDRNLDAVANVNRELLTALVQQTGDLNLRSAGGSATTFYYAAESESFAQHYDDWRRKRVATITRFYQDRYGADFFAGKRVLELGCGYGDLGAEFAKLGADLTCSDARPEHLDVVRKRYPEVKVVQADLDSEWPFGDGWDVVLHLGLLYHLRAPEPTMRWASQSATHLVLETEVCDSTDPRFILRMKESGYDQAHNGFGCRPSTGCVETILTECGMQFERLLDGSCNSGMHVYDWQELNTGAWRHGLRRLWFACAPMLPGSNA